MKRRLHFSIRIAIADERKSWSVRPKYSMSCHNSMYELLVHWIALECSHHTMHMHVYVCVCVCVVQQAQRAEAKLQQAAEAAALELEHANHPTLIPSTVASKPVAKKHRNNNLLSGLKIIKTTPPHSDSDSLKRSLDSSGSSDEHDSKRHKPSSSPTTPTPTPTTAPTASCSTTSNCNNTTTTTAATKPTTALALLANYDSDDE
jgi:hypothetical protein